MDVNNRCKLASIHFWTASKAIGRRCFASTYSTSIHLMRARSHLGALKCHRRAEETNALWRTIVATIVMVCSGALCSANINRGSAACLMT